MSIGLLWSLGSIYFPELPCLQPCSDPWEVLISLSYLLCVGSKFIAEAKAELVTIKMISGNKVTSPHALSRTARQDSVNGSGSLDRMT